MYIDDHAAIGSLGLDLTGFSSFSSSSSGIFDSGFSIRHSRHVNVLQGFRFDLLRSR